MKVELDRKTYVEFFCPGILFSESSSREVKTREVSKVKAPKNAFGFRFFDKFSGGEKVKVTSNKINISPMHYYGKLYTLAEVKRKFPGDKILISNMKVNGYKKVVRCRTGNWQPFNKTDILVGE